MDIKRLAPKPLKDRFFAEYLVPGSPIFVKIVIDDDYLINRPAMGRTILKEKQTLGKRLETQGNDWLAVNDDPYEIDDRRSGLCMIGMKSVNVGGKDRARLTYLGVNDVLQALWDVLYLDRRNFEAKFAIYNGTLLVGNGHMKVGNVQAVAQQSASE
ncbi:MAG: hypothetical protein Q9182_001482 [Xanthomendoza sp. 2 TL-2023]